MTTDKKVVNLHPEQPEQPELNDAELDSAARIIGLQPTKAYIRKERSKNAEKQARYRERQKEKGVQQVTLTADEQTKQVIEAMQNAQKEGKPVHTVLIEEARKLKPAEEQPVGPSWRHRHDALKARIDAFNSLPWWRRIGRKV